MKSFLLFLSAMLFAATCSLAQSDSYLALKNKFSDQSDVYSFSVGGWMGRALLKMSGEHEFSEAIKDLKHIRIITIPEEAFSKQHVSLRGFKKILKQDYFEELAVIRDMNEEVSIYLREGGNHKNHYFVLVESDHDVVAIELKGYIDLKQLNPQTTTLASNQQTHR